ncbi:MAG TPA: carboxypeptidase regulatory-like domain-containing protein, partial [Thermoanaerobaculia bacterium]
TQPFAVRVAGRELAAREVEVPGLVERAWARARLRELEKPEEIAELGKKHTMLTPRTSLIVLESWRDYQMYGIDTPPDLPPTASPAALKAVWFVKGTVLDRSGSALPGVTVTLFADGDVAESGVTDANGHFWLGAPRAPARFSLRAELAGFGQTDRAFATAPSGGDVELVMSQAAVSESITVTAEAPMLDVDGVNESSLIGLHHDPGDKQRFLRAAEALRGDDPARAIRKLTDLAEAYADDAPVVRIVARIAGGWGRPDVARDLLLHALELSPKEPQTWRELMLLARRSGRNGDAQALRARFDAVARSGRLRLPPDALNVDAHADADLQVDVMWECDYCDVDLHVTEPGGEEVMYSHRKSAHGGELSDDITGGFGPEIYAIARAPRGAYKIAVEYYGEDRTEVSAATLVHVIVTTRGRFGTERRDHTLLLSAAKERNEVTTVNVGGGH